MAAIAVSGASSRAFQRARAMTAARSSASMAATCTSTERTQSRDRTWLTTSCSIWLRSGQAAMVRATSTTTVAALDGDGPDHAEVDDGVAQLGVDHRPQAVADLLLAGVAGAAVRAGGRRSGAVGRGHGGNCTCVAANSGPGPAGVPAPPGAGNMVRVRGAPCAPGGRSPGGGATRRIQ